MRLSIIGNRTLQNCTKTSHSTTYLTQWEVDLLDSLSIVSCGTLQSFLCRNTPPVMPVQIANNLGKVQLCF